MWPTYSKQTQQFDDRTGWKILSHASYKSLKSKYPVVHGVWLRIKIAQRVLLSECQNLTFFHSILNVLIVRVCQVCSHLKAIIQTLKITLEHFQISKSHATTFLSIIKKTLRYSTKCQTFWPCDLFNTLFHQKA